MKNMILAALTGAAIVLSGCGNSEPERDTVTTSVESNSGFTATEDEFLYDVGEHMTPALYDEQQTDVLDLGYSICGAFDRGAEIEDVVTVGTDNGLTYKDTIVIAASAVVNLCPQHRNDVSISNMT